MAIRRHFTGAVYPPGGSSYKMTPPPPSYWPTRHMMRLLNKLRVINTKQYTETMRSMFPTQ